MAWSETIAASTDSGGTVRPRCTPVPDARSFRARSPCPGPAPWLILLATLQGFSVSAATGPAFPASPAVQFGCQAWGTAEGLPSMVVNDVAQTPDGFVWLATEEGLVRCDGISAITVSDEDAFSALSCVVNTLLAAEDGSLWVGTLTRGLFRLRQGNLEQVPLPGGRGPENVRTLCADGRGGVWVGTLGGGLVHIGGGEARRYTTRDGLISDKVRSLCLTRKGVLWVGTLAGASAWDGRSFAPVSSAQGLLHPFVACLAEDADGSVLLGTNGGGLYRWRDGACARLPEIAHSSILALLRDSGDAIWVGTNGEGIRVMSRGSTTSIRTADGLPGELVIAMREDRNGGVWAATSTGGAACIRKKRIPTITRRDGLTDDVVLPIFTARDGSVWIGTAQGGLCVLRDKTIRHYDLGPRAQDHPVTAIGQDSEGAIWVGCPGAGLFRCGVEGVPEVFTQADGLSSDLVTAVIGCRNGDLWVGTNGGGVNLRHEGRWSNWTTRNGLPHDRVMCLLEAGDGSVWVGTDGGGAARFTGGEIAVYDSSRGLGGDMVYSLHQDRRGSVWVGTVDGGLSRVRQDGVKTVTTHQGLFQNVVLQILEDGAGRLWMTCNRGIYCASREDVEAVMDGRRERFESMAFGKSDGMNTSECNGGILPAGSRVPDGRFWFPTMKGVAMVEPEQLMGQEANGFPVHLDRVTLNGQVVGDAGDLSIAAGIHRLELDYVAPNFGEAQFIRYRFRLDGFDPGWVDAGSGRTAVYTNLPPGEYAFRAQWRDRAGRWRPEVRLAGFKIVPPFTRTAPFYFLCILAFGIVLFIAHKLRVRSIRTKELVRLVEERTRSLMEEVKRRSEAEAQARGALGRNKALTREIQHRVRNHLQLLIGVISLQRNQTDDATLSAFIGRLEGRIHVLALVHDCLHRSENLSRIDTGDFLQRLVDTFRSSTYTDPRAVDICVKTSPTSILIDSAIPLGLLIAEILEGLLVPEGPECDRKPVKQSRVRLEYSMDGSSHRLVFALDGRGGGLDHGAKLEAVPNDFLVRALLSQVGAVLAPSPVGEAGLVLSFRETGYRERV